MKTTLRDEYGGVCRTNCHQNLNISWISNEDTICQVLNILMMDGLKLLIMGRNSGKQLFLRRIIIMREDIWKFLVKEYLTSRPDYAKAIDNNMTHAQSAIDESWDPKKNASDCNFW